MATAFFIAWVSALLSAGVTCLTFRCEAIELTDVEPLWGSSSTILFHERLASGADALIVTTRVALLDDGWHGRRRRADLLPAFEQLGVDPCGEHCECHTVVTNGPLSHDLLPLRVTGSARRADCWVLNVVPDASRE